jgi:hypothetical protein
MAKKELYYFCVSVDNGVKPRTDRPHYYGYTIATSESDAQSKACSYINEVTDWGKDGHFECVVEAVRYADKNMEKSKKEGKALVDEFNTNVLPTTNNSFIYNMA